MESLLRLKLLKSNFSAFSFQFGLQLFSLSFGSALFQYLRSAVNYFFRLFQAQTCSFTNNFDNFNFVRANFCQLYVELVFLFSCCCIASACCCNYNARCCGYTKLFFTCFYQFV